SELETRNPELCRSRTGANSKLSEAIRNFRFFSGPIPYDSATDDSADSYLVSAQGDYLSASAQFRCYLFRSGRRRRLLCRSNRQTIRKASRTILEDILELP